MSSDSRRSRPNHGVAYESYTNQGGDRMTLRQEVEVHEIHAESDYDEDDEGPVAGADGSRSELLRSRNRKEPFENLPRPSNRLHRSVLQQRHASPLVNFCLPQPPVKQNCTSEVEEPYDSDMTHSYRLTEGRLTR